MKEKIRLMKAKDFKSADSSKKSTIVYRKFKFFCILGFLIGKFPALGVITATSSRDLKFRKLSVWSLLTWCGIIISSAIFREVNFLETIVNSNSTLPIPKLIITDNLANAWSYNSIFINGLIAPIMIISRIKRFLHLLQLIEAYDEAFPSKVKATNILSFWVICSIISSALNMFVIMASTYLRGTRMANASHKTIFIFFGISTELWMVYIVSLFATMTLEYGSFFIHLQMFYLSNVLTARLSEITAEAEEKSNREIYRLGRKSKETFFEVKGQLELEFSGFETPSKSWRTLGSQYLELERAFSAFEQFSGVYFIILLTLLIISIVCMIFASTHPDPFGQSQEFRAYATLAIIAISSFRINSLTNVGQTFQDKYLELVKASMKYGQLIPTSSRDREEFEQFQKLVSTIPIKLSAGGFFTVQRQNITSIVSVIITYIIVLLQFRASE